MKKLVVAGVLALLAGLVAFTPAAGYKMEPEFLTLDEKTVTPHIPWGKDYAGGKVKALFIVPRNLAREVIELAERLDLDYQYVLLMDSKEMGWTAKSGPYAPAEGLSNDQVSRQLTAKLKGDYDVIITGQITWDMFPRETLYTILEKIHDGTGLVVGYQDFGRNKTIDQLYAKHPQQDDFVTTGVPLNALPVLKDQKGDEGVVRLRQFKEGRLALLNYGGGRANYMFLTPYPPDTDTSYRELHYEYYMSLVAKAVLWAARKEPAVRFASLGLGGETVDWDNLGKARLTAKLTGATPGLRAQVTFRDEDGVLAEAGVLPDASEVAVKDNQVSVPLPVLPVGKYFADVILRSGKATVNWGSVAFAVTSDVSIAALTLDKRTARPDETVTAEVKLKGTLPMGGVLRLTVVDNQKRVLLAKEARVAPGVEAAKIPFRLANPLAVSAEVHVFLIVPPPPLFSLEPYVGDHASAPLFLPLQRSRGNFAHAVWGSPGYVNDFVHRLQLRQLQNCDVDLHTNGPTKAAGQEQLQASNFDNIPYATRYSYDGADKVRKPCLTDPKFLTAHLEGLRKLGTELGPYGPRAYTLGDECFLARNGTDVCWSPTCLADFREWLQGQYPSVAALNASWGTGYQSFAEAEPITLDEAHKLNQPARWVDHRRHMEFVYARMMSRAREAIRQGDPQAEVGFDGPFDTDSFSGNDWWQLMDAFTMCNVYFHQPTQWEFLRSFARPNMLLGLWYGGYFEHRTEDEERMWPWKGLLNGFNSMWWYAVWHGNYCNCPMDAITPSGGLYPSFAQATQEIQEIKAGTGLALMNATRQDLGIGVHYSQSSLHASTWDPTYGRLDAEWLQTFGTLEDLGLQYTVRAYAQLEQDGLDPKRFPVFLLPCSQALSPREAQVLRDYVAAGGLLVADVRPGLYDQHGKPQSPGLLDDLFGLKRVPGKGVQRNVAGKCRDPQVTGGQELALENLDVDGDVQVADGKALGEAAGVPIVIVKPTGKGRAVLLNYSFAAPYRGRLTAAGLTHWAVLKGLFALGKVRPPVTVARNGEPLRHLETVCYQDGPVEYVAFLKYRDSSSEPTAPATIATARKLHTYDMRAGRYVGNVAQWDAEFVPARAKLFARLPYTVEAVKVSATVQPATVPGQQAPPRVVCKLALATGTAKPGRHWVDVRLTGPDGQPRRWYRQVVPAIGGQGTVTFPLALNDARGQWKVTARDALTGKTGTASFKL